MEMDDEITTDENDKEALQEIVYNTKLSEGYLTLARDIEVMEPKSPEDIYKVTCFVFIIAHMFLYRTCIILANYFSNAMVIL